MFSGKNDFEKFSDAFRKRYRDALKYSEPLSDDELLGLYFDFRESSMSPEKWLEKQELS